MDIKLQYYLRVTQKKGMLSNPRLEKKRIGS